MNPQTIKAKLVRQGITQQKIASQVGVSRQTVHKVIHGYMTSGRVELAIWEAAGLRPNQTIERQARRSS